MGKTIKLIGLGFCLAVGKVVRPRGTPVLVYHSIDDSGSYMSTSPAMFRAQMSYLKTADFRAISLDQLISIVERKGYLPEKTVALTFDDGLSTLYHTAWPIIRQFGFSATAFVPTDFIGKRSAWFGDYGLAPIPMLGWGELKELMQEGADIQSHGCSHRRLTSLSSTELEREIQGSKQILENGLGRCVRHFCYPFGSANERVKKAVKLAGYQSAASIVPGVYRLGDDPYMIRREGLDWIRIDDQETALRSIEACAQGSFSWYIRLKLTFRRLFTTSDTESRA